MPMNVRSLEQPSIITMALRQVPARSGRAVRGSGRFMVGPVREGRRAPVSHLLSLAGLRNRRTERRQPPRQLTFARHGDFPNFGRSPSRIGPQDRGKLSLARIPCEHIAAPSAADGFLSRPPLLRPT